MKATTPQSLIAFLFRDGRPCAAKCVEQLLDRVRFLEAQNKNLATELRTRDCRASRSKWKLGNVKTA